MYNQIINLKDYSVKFINKKQKTLSKYKLMAKYMICKQVSIQKQCLTILMFNLTKKKKAKKKKNIK